MRRARPDVVEDREARRTRWDERPVLVALALAGACFLIYLANFRLMGAWDTVPSRMLPLSILREGDLDLDEFPWLLRLEDPYFVRVVGSHIRSRYPVAVPLLVAPLYTPAAWWLQRHQVANDDVRLRVAAVVTERVTAAAIAAASVALLFLALRKLTQPRLAAGVAAVYAIGSSTWVINSQALWQHGPAALALAGLSLCFLGADTRRAAIAAGLFAAFGVMARPTMIIFALLALLFMWRQRRQHFVAFCALPAVGAAALLAYNLTAFGRLLGGYATNIRLNRKPQLSAMWSMLVSPSRGLLVYTPAAALSLPQILRLERPPHAWLPYAAAGVVGYVLLYGCFRGWWGGWVYGPRFLVDMLPALAILAVPTVERLWQRSSGRVLVSALALWGVVVQAIGVYCDDKSWDALPVPVDGNAHRVWDWSDPQILRALRAGWQGTELTGVLWQAFTDPRPVPLRELGNDDLRGTLTLTSEPPQRWPAGERLRLNLQLTNGSTVAWPAFSDYGFLEVQLVCVWSRDGERLAGEGDFIKLPRSVHAGESANVRAVIDTPRTPGIYDLRITLAQVLDVERGRKGTATVHMSLRIE